MKRRLDTPQSLRRERLNKDERLVPSPKQLADRFFELQRLRQQVREAEARQKAGHRTASHSTEPA